MAKTYETLLDMATAAENLAKPANADEAASATARAEAIRKVIALLDAETHRILFDAVTQAGVPFRQTPQNLASNLDIEAFKNDIQAQMMDAMDRLDAADGADKNIINSEFTAYSDILITVDEGKDPLLYAFGPCRPSEEFR